MKYTLTRGRFEDPADRKVVDHLSMTLGVDLPTDYLEFLRLHNGGEGFIGESYVIFWKAEELGPFNRDYEVNTYVPGFLFFASDGGGDGYAFDTTDPTMPIYFIPFIGMSREDAMFEARDMEHLFQVLAARTAT